MRAGQLRQRVTIRQPDNEALDGYAADEYSDLATVWGSIEPMGGREFLEARAQLNAQPYRYRLRFYPGVTERHRLQVNGDEYKIESLENPSLRNVELVGLATLVKGGG